MADETVRVVRIAGEWDRPETRAWCESLETLAGAVPAGSEVYRGRNLIFRTVVEGREVAVKRFPVERPRNRLIYRFRATKGVRAFDHAVRLQQLAIGTPRPFAAVEVRRASWPTASYFCSAFVPQFREARALRFGDTPDRVRLLRMLGGFVARLHELGVLHLDLTAGNILLVPDPGRADGCEFELVDINRMKFGRVGPYAGLANLVQLRLNDDGELFESYCAARGLDPGRWRPLYDARRALRSITQGLRERTRPWRRRLGL